MVGWLGIYARVDFLSTHRLVTLSDALDMYVPACRRFQPTCECSSLSLRKKCDPFERDSIRPESWASANILNNISHSGVSRSNPAMAECLGARHFLRRHDRRAVAHTLSQILCVQQFHSMSGLWPRAALGTFCARRAYTALASKSRLSTGGSRWPSRNRK